MIIQVSLDFLSDSVLCFDPVKVLWKLAENFPEVLIDEKDYAEAEVHSIAAFLDERGDEVPGHVRSQMLNSIKRKARQNGPAFVFRLDSAEGVSVNGWARRYGVGFESKEDIANGLKARLISFLEGLGCGEVKVS